MTQQQLPGTSPEDQPAVASATKETGKGLDATSVQAQGMSIKARSQGELVRRRFLRHRGALGGMVVLAVVVLLAFTSIGVGFIPGWWDKSYLDPSTVVNRGAPTLDLIPWLDGDGLGVGANPFGQDNVGKDYFALTMRGAQRSLIIAFIVGLTSTAVGTLIGSVAGYFRGWVEAILMRFTDVMITIPTLVIAAVLGRKWGSSGILLLALVLGLVTWTGLARLVRGEFLSLREVDYVQAARALGASPRRIILRHMLPPALAPIIVAASLGVADSVVLEAALSFLGFGIPPTEASLGTLLNVAFEYLNREPYLVLFPSVVLVLIVLAANFIGDGLRDALDPRQRVEGGQ